MNILFICTANICRSAIAEGILKKFLSDSKNTHTVRVSSGGVDALVGCSPDSKTIGICREQGLDISSHTARQVTKDMLLEADIVLCMQTMHQQRIISAYPQFKHITFLLKEFQREHLSGNPEIKDPTGESKKYYRNCFSEIKEEILRISPGLFLPTLGSKKLRNKLQ
jgi:protein-tyrosine-phosphatase